MKVHVNNLAAGTLGSLLIISFQTQAVDTFLAKGDSASAFFFEESGCVSTSVSVIGSDIMEKVHSTPGRPDRFSGAGATLLISQSDACSYTPLAEASCSNPVPLANEEFNVSRKLETAILNATLECTDHLGGAAA